MGLYFLGTQDLSSIDMRHLNAADTVVVLGGGNRTWNEDSRAKLRFVEVAAGFGTRLMRSGEQQFCCATHPLLTWPGASQGVWQIFYHDDWPGSYRSINVNPLFWDAPIVSAADAVHRGERLPEPSIPLPELTSPGTRTNCLLCHALIDVRFSVGHAWNNGSDLVRSGTDEIIAHRASLSPIDAAGPYCRQCVEAAMDGKGLIVPYGCRYIERHNRSLPIGQELAKHPSEWKWTDHPYAKACRRYGDEAFEWMLPEHPAATSRRIERAAALVKNFKHDR